MIPATLALTVALAAPPFQLTDSNYAATRDALAPAEAELAWQDVPWRASLWAAAQDATREDRPILLWAMNGHPLACT